VCGLEVSRLPDNDPCYKHAVQVDPGLALDCHGRVIVIGARRCVDFMHLPEEELLCKGHAKPKPPPSDKPFLLCVLHREVLCEKTPVLFDDGAAGAVREEYNRVREHGEFCWRHYDRQKDVECWPEAWRLPDLHPDPVACQPPSGTDLNYDYARKLPPDCPCGPGVPIALVIPEPDSNPGWKTFQLTPRPTPRRLNRLWAPSQLTHIVGTNWEANLGPGTNMMTLQQFWALENLLEIYFDRPLSTLPSRVGGVNEFTFQVQYTDPCEPDMLQRLLPSRVRLCPGLERFPNMGAQFVMSLEKLRRRLDAHQQPQQQQQQTNRTRWIDFFITLKCDLILDVNGRAVDGNFLGGGYPTGDGVPGGTFETWFRVNLC
jgi:hypothetical protein